MWINAETYSLPIMSLATTKLPSFIESIKQDTRINKANRTEGTFWVPTEFDGFKCLKQIDGLVYQQRIDMYIAYTSDTTTQLVLEYYIESTTIDLYAFAGKYSDTSFLSLDAQKGKWITKTIDMPVGKCGMQLVYEKSSSNCGNVYIKDISIRGLKSGISIKWCIKEGNNYKVITDSGVEDIGTALTAATMLSKGMDSMPKPESISQFTDPDIIKWYSTVDDVLTPTEASYISVPKDRLLVQKNDVAFSDGYVKAIKSFEANVSKSSKASVLFVFSVDGGTSWNYFRDNEWHKVALSASNVREFGIASTTLSSISEENWRKLTVGNKVIRCAIALYVTSSSDFINIKDVKYNFVIEEAK